MARDKVYKTIQRVFIDNGSTKYTPNWSLNIEKLVELTSEELAKVILEDFEENKGMSSFNAQVIEVSGVNGIGDKFRYFQISLGNFIFSHHYTFQPLNNSWHSTVINQSFFENIIEPFQTKLKW